MEATDVRRRYRSGPASESIAATRHPPPRPGRHGDRRHRHPFPTRQRLPRTRSRAEGHRRCRTSAADLDQPAPRSNRVAAGAAAAVDRAGRAARAQARRPAPQSAQLFAQPRLVDQRSVADGGRDRQNAAYRRPAVAAVAGLGGMVAGPAVSGAQPDRSVHRKQFALAGRPDRAQCATVAGTALEHGERRHPLDARQQTPAGESARGPRQRAAARHRAGRAERSGSAWRRYGAPDAHLCGHVAQPQRRTHFPALPARTTGAGRRGRCSAPHRQTWSLRQSVAVAGRQASAVPAHRAAVLVHGADEIFPAPDRGAEPRWQRPACDGEAAAVGRPAQRQRCGDHRRAFDRLAQRCPGDAGLGRGPGRRRPVAAGRVPRSCVDAGGTVRPAAGGAGGTAQPLRRDPVGPGRCRAAGRDVVEDAQCPQLEDRTRCAADRA